MRSRTYTARLEAGRFRLYRGSIRIADFLKAAGEDSAPRVAALLNAGLLIPNCEELDEYLKGRIVPDWIVLKLCQGLMGAIS